MSLTDTPNDPSPNGPPPARSILRYTTVAIIIVALYVAWTFYSRYESNRSERQAIEAKKVEARKRVVDEIYGSGAVSFSTFSADTGILKRGESTELCYGVVNATTVKIDPPVEQLKPSYRHCIEISPKVTTTYTITATDAKGNSKSQSLRIEVR